MNKVEIFVPCIHDSTILKPHPTFGRIVFAAETEFYEVNVYKEQVDVDSSNGEEIGNTRTSIGCLHLQDLKKAVDVLEKALE